MTTRRLIPFVVAAAALAVSLPASAGEEAGSGRIVWLRVLPDDSAGQMVSAKPDGSDFRQLTPFVPGWKEYNPAPSADGRLILFERDTPEGVFIMLTDAHGKSTRTINTGRVDPCFADIEPAWTPDGRIVFTRVLGPFDANGNGQSALLYTTSTRGDGLRRLSQSGIDGVYEDYNARWTPDGRTVTFQRIRTANFHSAMFAMGDHGQDVRQLTPWELDAGLHEVSQATSGPTKGLIAFDTHNFGALSPLPAGESINVATVPVNCKTLAECTARIRFVTHNGAGPIASIAPSWSPAGTRIALIEWNREPWGAAGDVWTTRPDGSDRRRLTDDSFGDYATSWAPPTDASHGR
jgi:Tol biopolymer transport system component